MTSVQDNPPTIMIVEDDERLADLTCEYLQSNGLDVSVVSDGEEAIRRIRSEQPDLVVLDLMLPGADGLTVCREVRATFKNPILMLTARTDDMDQVLGLEMGADDYVAKPVKPRVLLARIRALLRRSAGRAEPLIQLRGVTLDPQSQQVTFEGKPVNLSRKEFVLLHELMAQPDRVLTRDRLEQSLYGWNEEVDSNTLEVHIHHLRRKLFSGLIRTLRGVGYMIERDA